MTKDSLGELINKAWEQFEDGRVAEAARLADAYLRAEPDGVDVPDAYQILALKAVSRRRRISLLRRGVEEGERVLQPRMSWWSDDGPMFWLALETRPYIRTRVFLARELWAGGTQAERSEAIAHAKAIVRLCPGGPQGVHYLLGTWLVIQGRNTSAESLVTAYLAQDPECPFWLSLDLLLAFRAARIAAVESDGVAAASSLQEALHRLISCHPLARLWMEMGREPAGEGPPGVTAGRGVFGLADPAWQTEPSAVEWFLDAAARHLPARHGERSS